jgi:hypothetical protein
MQYTTYGTAYNKEYVFSPPVLASVCLFPRVCVPELSFMASENPANRND